MKPPSIDELRGIIELFFGKGAVGFQASYNGNGDFCFEITPDQQRALLKALDFAQLSLESKGMPKGKLHLSWCEWLNILKTKGESKPCNCGADIHNEALDACLPYVAKLEARVRELEEALRECEIKRRSPDQA